MGIEKGHIGGSNKIQGEGMPESIALPQRNLQKHGLTLKASTTSPASYRVRLFIDEIGESFFRVISKKFTHDIAIEVKKSVTELRELGQEFISLSNEPLKQTEKGLELRAAVERIFSADQTLSYLPREAQVAVAKSYQLFLYLVEEAQDAERDIRARSRSDNTPNSLDPLLEGAISTWGMKDEINNALSKLNISFVFTKHPTTIKYREMQKALRAVSKHFARDDWRGYYSDKEKRDFNETLSLGDKERFRFNLDDLITKLWDLPPIRPDKPTVRSEIEEGYDELKNEILPGMSDVRVRLQRREFDVKERKIWELKQWMGFDADGNPFVDKDSASGAIFLNNLRYIHDTIRRIEPYVLEVDGEVKAKLKASKERLISTLHKKASDFKKSLIETGNLDSFWYESELEDYLNVETKNLPYDNVSQFLSELALFNEEQNLDSIERLISDITITGFTLSRGQFRENSQIIDLILSSSIQGYKSNKALSSEPEVAHKERRQNESLITEFFNKKDPISIIKKSLISLREKAQNKKPYDKALQSIEMLEYIAAAQKELSADVCPEFILSLTENRSQIFGFGKLISATGMQKSSRIIPLFEEYETLSNIDELLSDFFENDKLLQMMKGDKDYVTVFVGMSDGQKTTGPFFPYLASDAEERSLGVSEKFGIKILVYQGIGSSQSRGQDRHPEREYGAKPSIRYSPQIERTIQGEAIHRLRPQDLAKHAAAIITNHVLRDEEAQSLSLEHNREIDSQKRNAVLQMNKVAREAFSNLTLSEEFSYFLAHFSPPLDSLNPASRPNNRSTNPDAYPYQCNFPDLRAVPANYQDIQAQTLLSTFYGAGEAFRQANDTTNTPGNLPITDLLYRKNSYFYDARFHKNVQFMIEAIASSGIDVTEAMLDMRLQAVKDPNIAGYLKSTLTKIKEAQDLAVTELEQFVETDGTASGSSSARDRAASMLDNPLLKEDISRRLPYITVLSFISIHGLNTFDLYAAKDNEASTFGFDLARIAACGKANGYRQVG